MKIAVKKLFQYLARMFTAIIVIFQDVFLYDHIVISIEVPKTVVNYQKMFVIEVERGTIDVVILFQRF